MANFAGAVHGRRTPLANMGSDAAEPRLAAEEILKREWEQTSSQPVRLRRRGLN